MGLLVPSCALAVGFKGSARRPPISFSCRRYRFFKMPSFARLASMASSLWRVQQERLRLARGNEPPTGGHLPGATAIIVAVPTHALPRALVVLRLFGSLLVRFGLLANPVILSRTRV